MASNETIKFSLFKNDYKKADSHPDLKGKGEIKYEMAVRISKWLKTVKPGTDMPITVAGWNSETKQGKRYVSGIVQDADYQNTYIAADNEADPDWD